MKKLVLCLIVVGLLVLALGGTASAKPPTLTSFATAVASTNPSSLSPAWAALADPINPTVTAIDPASAANDIDTVVTITGADFATDGTGTVAPTASLGTVALTDVTWVSSTTLTATVPWGMDPGVYDLTVVNPDGGTGSLPSAFTVTQGLGQWNGGALMGGAAGDIQLEPGHPATLYAVAPDVGVFRSEDAGEHWSFITVRHKGDFVVDPLNPKWVYSYDMGLYRSEDEGDTWTKVPVPSSSGCSGITFGQVYPSPHDPQVLFLAYSGWDSDALGLYKSTNGGTTWKTVADVYGLSVEAVAFHPTDPLEMVLATTDGWVYQSTDEGAHWSKVEKPLPIDFGDGGSITYNPFVPGQVWVGNGDGGYRSKDSSLTDWQDVTPTPGWAVVSPVFAGTESDYTVYIGGLCSPDDGESWQPFGPTGNSGVFSFDLADPHPQVGYVGDGTYGVQKTTDGGQTWEIKDQGLTAMFCTSMALSQADPLRVLATFAGWPGIYTSDDGANTWTYFPMDGFDGVLRVGADPFDSQRFYAVAGTGFCTSTDGGGTWSDLGWKLTPPGSIGGGFTLEADPHQAGHLLLSARVNVSEDSTVAGLYSSTDYGKSWDSVALPHGLGSLSHVTNVAFDPETSGLVYLTTPGKGIYRSADGGTNWARIDDPKQPDLRNETCSQSIAIATHPRHILFVGTEQGPYRSLDGGATWESVQNPPDGVAGYMFVDGDSTRLYAGSGYGLFYSSDAGESWHHSAGAIGSLAVKELGYTMATGHAILYAATTGGEVKESAGVAAGTPREAAATASTLVDAGVYRRAVVPASPAFSSAPLEDGWVLESGKQSNAGGTSNAYATTLRLGDNAAGKQYRGILSFDTGASLPDAAVITKVTLRIERAGITGWSDPVKTFGGFMADIKKGCFGKAALQASDFQAAASKSYGPFKPATVSNWYSLDLSGAKAYINKSSAHAGRTQIRLRFKLPDNEDKSANYLSLYSGDAWTPACPQLIITYYVP